MSDKSGIEWTDATWNPVTGCTEVSPGCDHCYAKTFAERWRGTPGHHFEQGFDLVLRPERLDQPLRWTKPRRVFVNSMSDLFHDGVPDEFIAQVFAVMALAPQHTFQLLTKRHGRMRSLLSSDPFRADVDRNVAWHTEAVTPWPLPNVWLGVSVENQQWADIRIPALLDTPAAVRFLSCEPLLGSVCLDAFHSPDGHAPGTALPCEAWPSGIDWVIVGGESGHGARPMHPTWVRDLRDHCVAAEVPFLFKQWGAHREVLRGERPRQGDTWVSWNGTTEPVTELDGATAVWVSTTDGPAAVRHLGKGKAGRELDGRTWDEYPEAVSA